LVTKWRLLYKTAIRDKIKALTQDGDMLHISYPLQDGGPLHNSDPLQDDIIGIIAHVNKVPENKEQDMDLSLFLLFESWFPNFFIVIKSGLLNLLSPVGSVAEWSVVGLFTVTKPNLLCFRCNVLHWTILDDFLQVQIFARLITKRLGPPTIPTATPSILHVLFNLKFEWFIVGDCSFLRVHVHPSHLSGRVCEIFFVLSPILVLPSPGAHEISGRKMPI